MMSENFNKNNQVTGSKDYMQQKTTQLVKANPYFWVTAEAGTSDGCKTFIDVQAQYITSGLIMKKKILQTIAKTEFASAANGGFPARGPTVVVTRGG